MQPTKTMGGPAEVAINGVYIPAEYLSEITPDFEGGSRERDTLGGKFTSPSGTFDTAQLSFTMFLPSMDYLKNLFPDLYTPGTGEQITGRTEFSTNTCISVESPVNIHYVCEPNDNNDIYIPNGLIQLNFNPTYNSSDALQVEVTVFANPDDNGLIAQAGTGDLTAESLYDPATDSWVPVGSS